MYNQLLKRITLALCLFTAVVSHAAVSGPEPGPKTHFTKLKHLSQAVEAGFENELAITGFSIVTEPVWSHHGNVFQVSFRAEGEFGPGLCTMRFNRNGGLILFDFAADNPLSAGNDEE